jgi:hypothetical protein
MGVAATVIENNGTETEAIAALSTTPWKIWAVSPDSMTFVTDLAWE